MTEKKQDAMPVETASKKKEPEVCSIPATPARKLTMYERVQLIRQKFFQADYKKGGWNPYAQCKYYTLGNIIPTAEPIIAEYNCMFVADFSQPDMAIGHLIDVTSGETLDFSFSTKQIAEPSKYRLSEPQAVGACITYYRRYLYSLLLDLVDKDEIDGGTDHPATANTKAAPAAKPATNDERKQIAKNLAGADNQATKLQIDSLKNVLAALINKDVATYKPIAEQVIAATKQFTEITKADCENLITELGAKLNG